MPHLSFDFISIFKYIESFHTSLHSIFKRRGVAVGHTSPLVNKVILLSAPLPSFRLLGQRLGQRKNTKILRHYFKLYMQKSS